MEYEGAYQAIPPVATLASLLTEELAAQPDIECAQTT